MADSGDKNTKRDRTLTDKGEDLHQSNKAAYLSKLQKLWTNIEALISDIENQTTLESLRVLNDKLNSIYVKYTATSQEYTNFLVRTKTNESQKEAEYLMDVIKSHNIVIDSALKQIFMKTKTFTLQSKASSHRSGRSSANSKRSSILVQKRAELEASKTKLKFAEEEAKIHKQKAMIEEQQELSNAKVSRQKAELQVDLNMLVQKKETEAAKVELEVYEAEEEVRSGLALSEYDVNQDINVVERTNKFVEEQVKNTVNQPTEREDLVTPIQRQYPDFVPTPHKGTSSQHIIPDFPLENTDTDKEIRPLVTVSKTNVNDIAKLGSNRFERFSSWMALVRAIARLKHFLSTVFSGTFHGWHSCVDCKSVHSFEEAQKFIIRVVQRELFTIKFEE
ncbi:unnamed protein product [Mytilus edulis]|uniref:Uncharacterized protein n=1 Tax=Mytilus edulis TaxID=6550 RepID=A0A8S3RRT9_MYTED|nr:unnamed protein product [Mytilus edulis]